ncbi:MAG: ABC transporter substrate binding protein [Desulfuromonadaceae bacterium]
MKRILIRLAMVTFFLCCAGTVFWVSWQRPSILVLHSYDGDYAWTREVDMGLSRILDAQNWARVGTYYMKTKISKDPDYLRRAGLAARRAIDTAAPDVLIAVDDAAQELAAKYYVNHSDMQIVFAGVNGGTEAYGYPGAANVTGILERKPVAAIIECLRFLEPDRSGRVRVMLLCDRSYSATSDADYLLSSDWGDIDFRGARRVDSLPEWQQAVAELAGTIDYLLVGGYRQLSDPDRGGGLAPAAEVMSWTENHAAMPVIGINVFNVEDGAMLAVGVSPFEQGEVAAEMALKLVQSGQPAVELPVRTSQQYVIAMRRSVLQRRQIEVPRIVEAFARATNNYYP